MAEKNYYQILEVPTDAGEREVKRAYHTLAKRLHPDRANTPKEARRLEEQMALISQAYNTLKDPEKKAEYDGQLKRNAAEAIASAKGDATATKKNSNGAGSNGASSSSGTSRRAQIAAKAVVKGIQLIKSGDYEKAVEFLEAACENNEEDALCHARLAEALMLSGRSISKAARHADRAIEIDPWQIDHRLTLARIYEQAGIKSRAVQAYREVLKWDAANVTAKSKLYELDEGTASKIPFVSIVGRFLRRRG
jgi:curved DNA-binding protein CbpA